ncbi:MAG: hypothetical protein KA978_04935 [Deltaproteobacteria bacterium]|nr:hypothetical protein [Deltaproteobacteria bacterium]
MSAGRSLGARLAEVYPSLGDRWTHTSPSNHRYNCFAWAAGVSHRHWSPDCDPEDALITWPAEAVGEGLSAERFVRAYETVGFSCCANGTLEAETEKVALYADAAGDVVHAAWQREDGWWWSKFGGEWEDFVHATAEALLGGECARVAVWLQRPRMAPRTAPTGAVNPRRAR